MISPSDQIQRPSSPLWRAPALCYPSGSLVPWSTPAWQVMTADRYKVIWTAWHVNSQGLCELEEKSPNLAIFPRKASSRERSRAGRRRVTPALQPLSSSGQGNATLQRARYSQVHVEAFQATQLLTALQLLFHAVLLYITLLSLPGGTAVLQYSRLAKRKTDFSTSQISSDCCCCSHGYKPSSVLHLPAFVHVQRILGSSLQPPSQLSASSLPVVLPSPFCGGQPSSASNPRCHCYSS